MTFHNSAKINCVPQLLLSNNLNEQRLQEVLLVKALWEIFSTSYWFYFIIRSALSSRHFRNWKEATSSCATETTMKCALMANASAQVRHAQHISGIVRTRYSCALWDLRWLLTYLTIVAWFLVSVTCRISTGLIILQRLRIWLPL